MKIKQDLIKKQEQLKHQRINKFLAAGVIILDPVTTYIDKNVKIGPGSVIYPLTIIESDVRIGKGCAVGPFARLRPGTRLKDGAQIGNFVEVVRSQVGRKSKAKHLTYIGDTAIGEGVNVGAGTIVANYDGKNKHKTKVSKGAFIGSGSILIAPVKVGESAVTAAGAVLTKRKNIPAGSLAVGVPARVINRKSKIKHQKLKIAKKNF